MKKIITIVVATIFLFVVGAKAQNDGDLDVTFNTLNDQFPATLGASGRIIASAVQPDGKIIIGGQFTSYNGVTVNRIARLNEDGSLDLTFNTGTGANSIIQSIVLLPNGKIVIAGKFSMFNQNVRNGIARINADGTLDMTFDPMLGTTEIVALAAQTDGKLLIGGLFSTYNNIAAGRIARINLDGSLDSSFNVGTGITEDAAAVNSIVIEESGKIWVGGKFTHFNGIPNSRIVKLNADGSFDNNFNAGSGANNIIQTMALQEDGKIIIAGSFTNYNGTNNRRITRLNSDGSLDLTFNANNAPNGILSIGLQPDGKILLGGRFNVYNNINCGKIFRLNSNGEADLNFNYSVGANSNILNFSLQANQNWIVVGQFTSYNNMAQNYIAKIDFDGNSNTDFNVSTFIGANNRISSLSIQQDGKSIIAGQFTTYNGLSANRIARVDQNGNTDDGFNVGSGANNTILATKIQSDGKILVGGQFTNFNGISINRIVRLKNDGSIDENFNIGLGTNGTVQAIGLQNNGKIIIAGLFTSYNGVARNGVARLNQDGGLDQSFDPGQGAFGVTNIAIQEDGKIILGGTFNTFNDVPCGKIARINADGTLDTSFNIGSGVTESAGSINAVAVQRDGKIIVGGRFTLFNQSSKNRLVRLHPNGSFDDSFNVGVGANNIVQTLLLQPDGKIIIAGQFTTYSGQQRRRLARINTDGSLDTSFNAGESAIGILTAGIQPDGNILVGGSFTSFNNIKRNCIARVNNQIQLNILETSCNSTIVSASNEYVFATNLQEVDEYEFKMVSDTSTQFLLTGTNSFRFSDLGLGNFSYGTTYQVAVRAKSNGLYTEFSNSCPIALIANPTTSMDGFCNETMPGINSKIYFFLVPQATEYRYSVTDMTTNEEQFVTSNKRFFYITNLTNYSFNNQYVIKCQVKINGVFGDFGPSCILTTANPPTTQLRNQFCNTTLQNLNENIFADVIVGATAYKFKVELNGVSQEIERPDSRFAMVFAEGIQPNSTYNVAVAVFFNNAWQPYGIGCTISTPINLPSSELRPQFCGGNVATLSSNFYAVSRVGASAYRFKALIDNNEIIVERPDARCFMSAFAGAITNQTYEIQVAVRFGQNWSEYGAPCSLTVGVNTDNGNNKQIPVENDLRYQIKAYPNPFFNIVHIDLSQRNIESIVSLYDISGKLIASFKTTENQIQVGEDLKSGIYFVQIIQGQKMETIRLLKQ